jgi:hypothetical protein
MSPISEVKQNGQKQGSELDRKAGQPIKFCGKIVTCTLIGYRVILAWRRLMTTARQGPVQQRSKIPRTAVRFEGLLFKTVAKATAAARGGSRHFPSI